MTTLKHYSLPLAILAVALILLASITWHCNHCQPIPPANGDGPALSLAPGSETPAATTTLDWSLIGQAAGALIAGVVGVWQLIRKRNLAGAFVTSTQLIRDAIKHGGSMSPSAEKLGDDLCEFTEQTGSGPAYELAMRVAGERLLKRYTITVKP